MEAIRKKIDSRFHLLFALLVSIHTLLLTKIVFFPYPELFVYPYLTNIGLTPYRDILDQHFPGLMFLPLNLGNLGINSIASMRVVQLSLVVITHLLLYLFVHKITASWRKAFIASLLYVVWQAYFDGYTLWIDSFIPPIFLTSIMFLLKGALINKRRNYFLAGLILGAALVMKQVVLPLVVVIALYLFIRDRWKTHVSYFLAGFSIPVSMLVLYMSITLNWQPFYYWAVTFNMTVFNEMGRKYPMVGEVLKASILFGPAILSGWYLMLKRYASDVVPLVFIYFAGSLIFAYARFDFIHLQPAIPFAIVLIVLFASAHPSISKKGALLLFLCLSIVVGAKYYYRHLGNNVYFFGADDQKVFSEVSRRVQRDDPVFAFATYPHIYYVTNTHPSGNIFVFQFHWFMKVAEPAILKGLILEPPKVVIRDTTAEADGVNLVTHMPEIATYIDKYYKVDTTIGSTEILIPR